MMAQMTKRHRGRRAKALTEEQKRARRTSGGNFSKIDKVGPPVFLSRASTTGATRKSGARA